jgi:RimJ/RimL family protein N-acetyltransferase
MNQTLNLREINQDDWKILLEWRNDVLTRQNFYSSQFVSESEHKNYIKDTIDNSERRQFILEYNGIEVGTIREDVYKNTHLKLSYTINPLFRGKKIGQMMISLYLIDKTGVFLCEVKKDNIASIKMIEKVGFKFLSKERDINIYKLNKLN